ncbi:MAG: hypothetical protein MPK30_06475 [Gammaproteobacteria bacterium]|nr:hypothetical protein [Gammaproteobacteria bacterium]
MSIAAFPPSARKTAKNRQKPPRNHREKSPRIGHFRRAKSAVKNADFPHFLQKTAYTRALFPPFRFLIFRSDFPPPTPRPHSIHFPRNRRAPSARRRNHQH